MQWLAVRFSAKDKQLHNFAVKIETIAIVGAREMGAELALTFLRTGCRVVLEDVSLAGLQQAIARIQQSLQEDVTAGKLATRDREAVLSRLTTANNASDACREADLIVEAVADEEEMKVELFTIFDKFAKPRAIFASTTASVSITDLAEMTVFPERCIGLRLASGGDGGVRMHLERGAKTSQETVAACREVGERIGAKALVSGPR